MAGPANFDPNTQAMARYGDGQLRVVPIDKVNEVAATGGEVLDLPSTMQAIRGAEAKAEAETLPGQVRTASGAFLSGMLAPVAGMAGGTGEQATAALFNWNNPEQMVAAHEQMRVDAEANPTLQFVSSTLGTTGTALLAGGGVGAGATRLGSALGLDALAATGAGSSGLLQLGTRALAAAPNAAGFLTENALGGIGAANEQAFLENRELSAEEVAGAGLVGAGLGVGFGAAARGLSYGGSKLGQMVQRRVVGAMPEGKAGWESLANKKAFESAYDGASDKAFKNLSKYGDGATQAQEIGKRLIDEGIPLKATKEAVDLLSGKLKDTGHRKGAIEALGHGHFDADGLIAKIRAQADEVASVPGTETNAAAQALRKEAAHLEKAAKAGKLDIDMLAEVKSNIGKKVRKYGREADTIGQEAYLKYKNLLSDEVASSIQKADDALGGGGGLVDEWRGINKEYAQMKGVKNVYDDKLAKETQNSLRGGSLRDSVDGGNIALMGSLMTGNVGAGALLALGTKAVKKQLSENGNMWASQLAQHMAKRGEIPSMTKLLAASSEARRGLGKVAVTQLVQRGGRKLAETEAPAGFGYGALANYVDPKRVKENYSEASTYLQKAEGDLEGMSARAMQQLGAIAREQPELATAAQMKMARAIDYLRDTQPVSTPTSVLAVAFGNQSKSQPPPHEQAAWLKRFRATVDPSVIYGEIARGYINPETVETLETLYPSYLATVREGVLGTIAETKPELSYSQRLSLDNLFGGTGVVEPTRRQSVQERLQQANAEVTEAAGPQAPSSRKAPDIAQFGVTTSARLMST
jgi:hypothetical protein